MNLQLKRLRKQAGYKTQKDVADALGIPERRYSSWEREEVMMSLEQACLVADLLDCSLDELVGRGPAEGRGANNPRLRHICDCYDGMDETGREGLKDQAEWLYRKHQKKDGELQVAQHRYA